MPQSANNPATGRWNGRAGRQGADPGAGRPTGAVNPNRPGRSGTGILRQDPRTALPPLLRKGRGTALPRRRGLFVCPASFTRHGCRWLDRAAAGCTIRAGRWARMRIAGFESGAERDGGSV